MYRQKRDCEDLQKDRILLKKDAGMRDDVKCV